MPKEAFYDPATIEGADFTTGQYFDITWGREIYPASAETDTDAEAGVWLNQVKLDPSGINRLIKTLHKARDQAYGRGE